MSHERIRLHLAQRQATQHAGHATGDELQNRLDDGIRQAQYDGGDECRDEVLHLNLAALTLAITSSATALITVRMRTKS
jgi:hypothetical protein